MHTGQLRKNGFSMDEEELLDAMKDVASQLYSIVEKGQFAAAYTSEGNPVFIDESYRCILTEEEKEQIRFEPLLTSELITDNSKLATCGSYNIYLGDNIIHTGTLISKPATGTVPLAGK